mgnify:CR=1 FL=1|tara:strand:+ start:138 stop:365 length:228 start_codon:yes stop_codon:yes gene_type:complete
MKVPKFTFNKHMSIEEVFENYKTLDGDQKPELINFLLLSINSGDIKYQIILNVICKFEGVLSLNKLLAYVNNKYK